MALLTTMVLGLLMVFNQVQRAFRSSLGQTDMLEGGRGAMEMLVRELEQMTPSEAPSVVSHPITWLPMNFWSGADPSYPNCLQYLPNPNGTPGWRTNVLDRFFLLTRLNQDWVPIFYRVQPAASGSAVGSLFRYCMTNCPRYSPPTVGHVLLWSGTLPTPSAWSASRVADGVIHLRLRAFDTNGVPLVIRDSQHLAASVNPSRPSLNNASSDPWYPTCDACFWSNAVPAYVELELGILEAKTLQHYLAIDPTTPAAQNYLSNHVGQVHLFRQRIPIRNVDFSAYQ